MTLPDEERIGEVEAEVDELYEAILNKYAFEVAPEVQDIHEAKRHLKDFSELPGRKKRPDEGYKSLSEFDRKTPEWVQVEELPEVNFLLSKFNRLLSDRKISSSGMVKFLSNDYETISEEAQEYGVSQATITTLYKDMEDLGVLTKSQEGYELTGLGKIFQSFFSRIEDIDDEDYTFTQFAIQQNY